MKMMTKEIEKVLGKYPMYSQEGLMGDAKVVCKFFDPSSAWTWYVTEGQQLATTGDWEFFGLVRGLEWEWGYFRLSDIVGARGHVDVMTPSGLVSYGGIQMERDRWLSPGKMTVAEVVRSDYGDCPEILLNPHAAHVEEVSIDASADVQYEPETWTAAGAGQQVLF